MRTTALAVAALLVLAGCSGQGGVSTPETPQTTVTNTGTPTTQPTTDTNPAASAVQRVNVTERGATLGDVNATKVWQRVGRLVSVYGPEPPEVVVRGVSQPRGQTTPPEFNRALGASNYSVNTSFPGGRYYTRSHRVVLWRLPGSTDAQMEAILAHEFAHVYQRNALHSLPETTTTFTSGVVSEGAAEYVQWTYADRYMPNYDVERAFTTYYRQSSPMYRLRVAEYFYGARYTRNFSEPGAPLASMYENPPRTAEEVLHGLPPGSEPPLPLSVHGDAARGWSMDLTSGTRLGEVHVRFALQIGVPRERARAAAEGWGNDRRTVFFSSDGKAYAWVIRWDTPADAREFERAFAAYKANVSVPVRLATVSNETTVLFAGHRSFVANASASGTTGNVTVAA